MVKIFSSLNENEDDGKAEFSKCIRVLADRVNFLSKHRLELLDMIPKLELANEKLRKELEEKEELIKTLYKRLQLEKQVFESSESCSSSFFFLFLMDNL